MIGERIVELRKKNGISQKELSEMAKIPLQTLCRYEKGTTNIPTKRVFAIADALNTTPATLMGMKTATEKNISLVIETLKDSGASSSEILALFTTQELLAEIERRCGNNGKVY